MNLPKPLKPSGVILVLAISAGAFILNYYNGASNTNAIITFIRSLLTVDTMMLAAMIWGAMKNITSPNIMQFSILKLVTMLVIAMAGFILLFRYIALTLPNLAKEIIPLIAVMFGYTAIMAWFSKQKDRKTSGE